jgi:predicted RNA-binding protein Jag
MIQKLAKANLEDLYKRKEREMNEIAELEDNVKENEEMIQKLAQDNMERMLQAQDKINNNPVNDDIFYEASSL